jgi:hypothetical protein
MPAKVITLGGAMMTVNIRCAAYANNEVAWVAWDCDAPIPGCLGFNIVREYLHAGAIVEWQPLASYVAFEEQSNPDWLPQNTTVWPIQKFSWRDLTLRKKRDRPERRPCAIWFRLLEGCAPG